jgi:chromosome segregation ATPase
MFIPLDSIQVKPTNDKYRNFARGARLAIDVIEFDPQFDAAMQHACGNSLICDTMDVARYVCYDKQQDVKGTSRIPISGFRETRLTISLGYPRDRQPSRSRAPSSTRAAPSPVARAPRVPAASGTRRRSPVRPSIG